MGVRIPLSESYLINNEKSIVKNLIIGIDENTDITKLIDEGIKQFYFGYIPKIYLDTYSTQTSLNRRYRLKEQFTNIDLINLIIETIHKVNGTIYLALNSFTSNDIMLKYSIELYRIFSKKIDGIIVANITIASMLKNKGYKNIVISNLFGVYNCQSVEFLQKQFNPIKTILPRDISLEAIEKIVTTYPNQLFECFLYGDNCRYSESFCFSEHGYDSTGFGSLCSFAHEEKLLIKVATPSYKQIVKNSKLTIEEKRKDLQKVHLDITSILSEIEINLYQFDSKKIASLLEILSRFDIENFKTSKALYSRSLHILKTLDFPKAKEILFKLKDESFSEINKYKKFHKLNSSAIAQTLEFFNKFDNIVSYKIPSRGRELYKFINNIDIKDTYNYTQSQYKL